MLFLAANQVESQQPTQIPNWTPSAPGTSPGQYAPGQYAQDPQYGYGQQRQYGQSYGQSPQYQQPPTYQQPLDYGQQAYGAPDQGNAPSYQPQQALSPDRLEQLVAPIALYPDNLVSIVLAASTYPAQVSAADQWLHTQGGAPPEQIAAGANAQSGWDPSIKALTAFPQVLDQLAQNLQWTTDLGNAYYNQPQDVMQTIQVMRGRAQSAGYLETTPQQQVVQDQGNIEVAPPTPDMVYVPQYNPWAVYGQPVDPYPGYNVLGAIGSFIGGAFFHFGPGIAMQAFAVTPFGWLGWGLDWFAHAIFFNHDLWCTHSYSVHDWGFAHGGGRYWGRGGELARYRAAGWGARGSGWGRQSFFRSGLDRGGFGNRGVHPAGGPVMGRGAERPFGSENAGRGFQSYGNSLGRQNGYIQSGRSYANGREPQPAGRPQQYGGAQQFAQNRGGYGSAGLYNHPLQSYGMRPGFGGSYSQPYRTPPSNSGNRASGGYGSYGSNGYRQPNIARAPSGGGFQMFGGGHSSSGYNYGGGSYKAPKAPSFSGHGWGGENSHSWGGGGGGYKAPHVSGGGGGHFSGGGGHSGGGHSGGGHGGGHHH